VKVTSKVERDEAVPTKAARPQGTPKKERGWTIFVGWPPLKIKNPPDGGLFF